MNELLVVALTITHVDAVKRHILACKALHLFKKLSVLAQDEKGSIFP